MTVPHITDQNCTDAIVAFRDKGFYSIADICNKAIEIALAEYEADWLKLDTIAAQEQYITADKAWELGAGKAEWRWEDGKWAVINTLFPYFTDAQYRAIKQPEIVEPLKQVSWKDVPVGAAVLNYEGDIFTIVGHCGNQATVTGISKSLAYEKFYTELELAPASEQPWIAVQDGETNADVNARLEAVGICTVWKVGDVFKITGLAEGWVLK